MQYAQHPQSQVVQTSWAVLALIYGEYPDVEVIKRACGLLMSRQKEDGRWEQEDTEGIFNKNCAIDYPGMSLFLFSFLFLSISPQISPLPTTTIHLSSLRLSALTVSSNHPEPLEGLALVSQLTNSVQVHLLYLGIG